MTDKRVALITGGARGIGHSIACHFNDAGYMAVVMDIADEFEGAYRYIKGDITRKEDRQRVLDTIVSEYGRIDILVNNAGVSPRQRLDILEMSEESMDFVMGINLKGAFFLTQLISNFMISETYDKNDINPVIINISSVSASMSSVNRGEYCISKAGVSMMTTLFADRLSEYGINVFEIRPGIILTDMTAVVKDKYDSRIKNGL